MQWSKIKTKAESFICERLKDRVKYFSTWYRSSDRDHIGRGVVLVDKKEVFEADTWKYILGQDVFEELAFRNALIDYVNLPINVAIVSENPIIRGLAMIDRRLGIRRLKFLTILDNEHPFVMYMYQLRCKAEGIS